MTVLLTGATGFVGKALMPSIAQKHSLVCAGRQLPKAVPGHNDSFFPLFLLRRLLRGEKIYQAHCSHAYQMAVKRHKNHVVVSSWVAVINLAWLGPLSWAVVNNHIDGFLGLIIAYIPLLVTAIYYKAGSKQ